LALRETTYGRKIAADVDGIEGDVVRANLIARAAIVRSRQSHAEQARRMALEAAELAERSNALEELALAYSAVFVAEAQLGHDGMAEWARRALDVYESLGNFEGQAAMALNLGVAAYYDNQWDETLKWYRRAGDLYRQVGNLLDAAGTEANIAEVLINQGRLHDAEPLLRDAVRVMNASGFVEVSFVEMHLGRLLSALGDVSGAERMLRSVVDNCTSAGQLAWAYEASTHLADCLIRSGRPDAGLDVLNRPTNVDVAEVAIFEAARAAVWARGLLAMGRPDDALEHLYRGVAAARRGNLLFDLAGLLQLACEIGPPFDPRLGTSDPAGELSMITGRLGLVTEGRESVSAMSS
jgi:tetratricopeptide (TPR) repeat protein